MKIAVTSCADPKAQRAQRVWSNMARTEPEHLILLGDQMYMDYAFFPFTLLFGNPGNGKPADMSDLDFAAHMHARYAAQWQAMKDSGLWSLPRLKVHGIWDDHDFGWDGSFGAGVTDDDKPAHKRPMPPAKQQIARHLFRQFFASLRAIEYPVNTLTDYAAIAALNADLTRPVFYSDLPSAHGTCGQIELSSEVRLLLTDGRSYRTALHAQQPSERTVLGAAQRAWLKTALHPGGVTLLASGCTLNDWAPESWRHYQDYEELLEQLAVQPQARVLFLSGDVHCTDVRDGTSARLIEVVASGAARPYGSINPFRPSRGNFVLIDVGPEALQVHLHEGESRVQPRRTVGIDRAGWHIQP